VKVQEPSVALPLTDEIICIEKHNGYTIATLKGKRQVVLEYSLEKVQAHLPANTFARIHKSVLVNTAEIIEIVQINKRQTIILSNGKPIPIAKRRKQHLLNKLERDAIIL